MQYDQFDTPFANELATEAQRTKISFHGLPLFRGAALRGSRFAPRYAQLFDNYLAHEATFISGEIDNFFFSAKALASAEQKAAEAFGAEYALFGTAGTTISNQIALRALTNEHSRVLVDRGCHQSIHFTLSGNGAEIDYLASHMIDEGAGRSAICLKDLLLKLQSAEAENRPYDTVVLNAHSYDGVMLNLTEIFTAIREHVVHIPSFLIDEAWAGANFFDAALRKDTAMAAARVLPPCIAVISTLSVHKSLAAMRQSSAIFARGPADLPAKLRRGRFMFHTTSPSYPILASIDMARAQMSEEGEALVSRARRLAALLKNRLQTEQSGQTTQVYRVCDEKIPDSFKRHISIDPMKISIDVSETGLSPQEVKSILLNKHGIYINRVTDVAILVNVHIGISESDIRALLTALSSIAAYSPNTSLNFVIPYPPGVPIIVPGDKINQLQRDQVSAARRSGLIVVNV